MVRYCHLGVSPVNYSDSDSGCYLYAQHCKSVRTDDYEANFL